MCGFIGAASIIRQENTAWLSDGADALYHRGPDNLGRWSSECGRVNLFHTRLKILDLSSNADQPFLSEDGKIAIVFNGEIYNFLSLKKQLSQKNHTWLSASDTEVVLRAYQEWGERFVNHLEGMFSIVIFDIDKMSVLMARDRVGEKPLFYFNSDRSIFFASELRALLANPALPRKVCQTSLNFYLGMGFVPKDKCILEGFHKLPPAEMATFNLLTGEFRKWKYWYLPEQKFKSSERHKYNTAEISDLKNKFKNVFTAAVKRQLVADVPVGILLSGGLDSSLVTAAAAQEVTQLTTFNVSFPEQRNFDESKHAKEIAEYFSTNHVELEVTSDIVSDLENIVSLIDEPVIDSSFIPTYLLCKEVTKHVRVALGGDGADELFGGYDHYIQIARMSALSNVLPAFFLNIISELSKRHIPSAFKGKNYFDSLSLNMRHCSPLIAYYFNETDRKMLLKDKPYADEKIFGYWKKFSDGAEVIDKATRADFNFYLPEDILVKTDRASMLNSLELRSPFLDYDVVDFAFSDLPSKLKANAIKSKIFLREMSQQFLPSNFNFNRKQGFNLPLRTWLKERRVNEVFRDNLLAADSIFDRDEIEKIFALQMNGFNQSERLFGLLIVQIWCRNNNVEVY